MAGAAALAEHARSIVIVLPSWVGDAVMATPVYRAVREARPGATITGIMRPGLDVLLAGNPWFDSMRAIHPKGFSGFRASIRAIREANADAVLLLPNSFRSGLIARLGTPGKAKQRIGYARDGRGWLLTDGLAPPDKATPISAVRYYADLAAWALGAASIDSRVELFTTDEEQQAAASILEGIDKRFILLNPGGNKPEKRWPAERFIAVGRMLRDEHACAIAVNGSPGERELVDEITAGIGADAINLTARGITLGSLKAVIQRAALVITNDTGPRHLAAALGTRCIALFGPTDHRWTTLNGAQEHLLLAEPFLPEGLMADRQPQACAIERIPVGDVRWAAARMLAVGR